LTLERFLPIDLAGELFIAADSGAVLASNKSEARFKTQYKQPPRREQTTMRYRTNHGVLVEAETSLDLVRRLRDESWREQKLSDQAYMEAVADRMYEQGIHVSTVSPDIFIAGLLAAGLLTRDTDEGASSSGTGEQIDK